MGVSFLCPCRDHAVQLADWHGVPLPALARAATSTAESCFYFFPLGIQIICQSALVLQVQPDTHKSSASRDGQIPI